MKQPLDAAALEQVFLSARTYNAFTDEPVTDAMIERLYDLLKWGPTSMNCQPGRYLFLRSGEAKERLIPTLSRGNQDKTRAAPATVIVAIDTRFYDHIPSQFPANPAARDMYTSNPSLSEATAFRNSTLQGAYLILAARMLGLDCGPMSGFDNAAVDAEFFPDGRLKANFLVNIGYGAEGGTRPRGPRLPMDAVIEIL